MSITHWEDQYNGKILPLLTEYNEESKRGFIDLMRLQHSVVVCRYAQTVEAECAECSCRLLLRPKSIVGVISLYNFVEWYENLKEEDIDEKKKEYIFTKDRTTGLEKKMKSVLFCGKNGNPVFKDEEVNN